MFRSVRQYFGKELEAPRRVAEGTRIPSTLFRTASFVCNAHQRSVGKPPSGFDGRNNGKIFIGGFALSPGMVVASREGKPFSPYKINEIGHSHYQGGIVIRLSMRQGKKKTRRWQRGGEGRWGGDVANRMVTFPCQVVGNPGGVITPNQGWNVDGTLHSIMAIGTKS